MPSQSPRPLSERFHLLHRSPDTSDEFRADLDRTDIEFGRKWRRHKNARLAELQRHEDQLDLANRRRFIDRIQPVVDQLAAVDPGQASGTGLLLDALAAGVVDHPSAMTAYQLATIRLLPELTIGDHESSAVLADVRALKLDETGVAVLRESICTTSRPLSDSRLAERFDITKQSVAERRRRLVRRLLDLEARRPFAALREVITDRIDHRGPRPRLRAEDPLVRIAAIEPLEHPDLIDVVSIGIWLASGDRSGDTPPGFEKSPDGLFRR